MRTITVSGAKGGQGTSTVAAALAVFAAGHRRTTLVSSEPVSCAALLGVSRPDAALGPVEVSTNLTLGDAPGDDAELVVIDTSGSLSGRWEAESTERYVVVRGPCYLALAALLRAPGAQSDGIIVVVEPGRSLSARDVTEVAGLPIVATVQASPTVARVVDAGLLVHRLHRLRELQHLRHLITRPPPTKPRPNRAQEPASRRRERTDHDHPPASTPNHHPSNDTDLPCPLDTALSRGRAPVKSRRDRLLPMHVGTTCDQTQPPTCAERGTVGARRRRLLPGRGGHLR